MQYFLLGYLIVLHLLWAIYATMRSTKLNHDITTGQQALAFIINLIIAPIAIVIATYSRT